MLKELEKELAKFQYTEDSELTKEEINTLQKMFAVKGSFKALFKHLCRVESTNGTQMMYEIENFPSDGSYSDKEIADVVRFKKMTTQFIRERVEKLRITFAIRVDKDLQEEQKKVLEEQEKNDKELAFQEATKKGVSPIM